MRSFDSLDEKEILALAISLEEEDERETEAEDAREREEAARHAKIEAYKREVDSTSDAEIPPTRAQMIIIRIAADRRVGLIMLELQNPLLRGPLVPLVRIRVT